MHSSAARWQVCDLVLTATLAPLSESETQMSLNIQHFGRFQFSRRKKLRTLVSLPPFREDGRSCRELERGGWGVTNRTRWLLCGSDHVTPGDIERFLSAALSPWIWGYNMAFVVT